MGYRISWLGARTAEADLLSAVGLIATDRLDEANEGPFSVAELPTGWSIIWSNDEEWATPERVEALARRVPTLACMVDETIMAASTAYTDPAECWHVLYGVEAEGALTGDWPDTLSSTIEAARRDQAHEEGDSHRMVDRLFDVPVAAAFALTGWCYDRWQYDWGRPVFKAVKLIHDRR